jgi:tetratricopeptide (TPR) repeat protein
MTAPMTDQKSFDSLIARAHAKIDAREFPEAAALIESALSIRSTPSLWQLLGAIWGEAKEKGKAREAYVKVVGLRPEDHRSWVNLGATELDLGLFDEAAKHYRRAIELVPDRADLRIWLANAYDRAGDISSALEAYRDAEAIDPANPELFYERGLALRNHRRFAEAAKEFRRAFELDPTNKNALELARRMALGPHEITPESGAVIESKTPENAALGNPENAILWNNLGWQKWQSGAGTAALTDFDRAIELQPDYLQARVNRAALLRTLGHHEQSEQEYRKIITLDPQFAYAHYNLAVGLQEFQRFDEALEEIGKAIAIDQTDADFFVLRGVILEGLKRKPEALADFSWALSIDGNHARAYFMRGNMQFDMGRLQTAVLDYTRSLEVSPETAEVYLNRGLCNFALNRTIESQNDLEHALQLKPGFGIAHVRLGQIFRHNGDLAAATRHLSAASQLGFSEQDWK